MATSSAAPDALVSQKVDPSQTKTLRRRYSQKLRGRYAKLNVAIREGVAKRDVFGLRGDALEARPIEDLPDLDYATDAQQHQAFMAWLNEQLQQGVLSVISRNENIYIKRAYKSGLRHAATELRKEGLSAPNLGNVDLVFNMPVHQDAVLLLYSKNYEALKGINSELAKQLSRTLAEGFTQGWNPRKMARKLTDRVNKIGKTRAETLARTAVIEAHATSTLNRFEQMGVDEVTGEAEFQTAEDARVCQRCKSLNGNTYPLAKARGMIPQHPRCRCVWLPVIGETQQATLP